MNKINCVEIKKQVLLECKNEVERMVVKPLLVTLKCENPASNVYVKQKENAIISIGAEYITEDLEHSITKEALILKIKSLNNDPKVTGILIQLPLYDHLKPFENEIINTIDIKKDIDGFVKNQETIIPCTALGIIELFKNDNYDITGKNVLIVGRGKTCAMPLFKELLKLNATVTIAHSKTLDLISLVKNADIIISTVGLPNFLNKTYFHSNIKKKDYLIDVGISKLDNGKITGDFHTEVYEHTNKYTITPGGTGQLTVAYLMKNLLKCKELQENE